MNFFIPFSEIELSKLIGGGEYGFVYTGNYKSEKVAIKMLNENAKNIFELLPEITICIGLSHKNILKIHGYSYSSDKLYLIMNYYYTPLENLVNEHKLNRELFYYYMRNILQGIDYINNNSVYHHDIHLKNIMISMGNAVLIDFGKAQKIINNNYNYNNIELILKRTHPSVIQQEFNPNLDLWSFLILLFEYDCLFLENKTTNEICEIMNDPNDLDNVEIMRKYISNKYDFFKKVFPKKLLYEERMNTDEIYNWLNDKIVEKLLEGNIEVKNIKQIKETCGYEQIPIEQLNNNRKTIIMKDNYDNLNNKNDNLNNKNDSNYQNLDIPKSSPKMKENNRNSNDIIKQNNSYENLPSNNKKINDNLMTVEKHNQNYYYTDLKKIKNNNNNNNNNNINNTNVSNNKNEMIKQLENNIKQQNNNLINDEYVRLYNKNATENKLKKNKFFDTIKQKIKSNKK